MSFTVVTCCWISQMALPNSLHLAKSFSLKYKYLFSEFIAQMWSVEGIERFETSVLSAESSFRAAQRPRGRWNAVVGAAFIHGPPHSTVYRFQYSAQGLYTDLSGTDLTTDLNGRVIYALQRTPNTASSNCACNCSACTRPTEYAPPLNSTIG